MSIYQCPNCGMTRSGNQAMGSVLPQCQCAWQFSPPVTPQRTWVNATTWRGLTDEEIWAMDAYTMAITDQETRWLYRLARAIEAKLKEKNCG